MSKRTPPRPHRDLDAWLVKHTPKGPPLAEASRTSRLGDPFAPPQNHKPVPPTR